MDSKIKALFFAQYWGQKILDVNDYEESVIPDLREVDTEFFDEDATWGCLLLRGVDKLTDIEILEIAILRGYRKDHLDVIDGKELKEIIKEVRTYLSNYVYSEVRLCIIDYLRLHGVITYFGYIDENKVLKQLSPTELIQLVWAKINP